VKYSIKIYTTETGKKPFRQWLDELSDLKARATIDLRIERMAMGNFGKCEPIGGSVSELKIDFGSGYRIYFSRTGKTIVLLLCAGTKRSQQRDIEKAKKYFQDYKIREG